MRSLAIITLNVVHCSFAFAKLQISYKILKRIHFFICFSLTKLLNGSNDLDLSLDACDVSVAVPELEIDPSDFALTIRSKLELEEVAPMPPV